MTPSLDASCTGADTHHAPRLVAASLSVGVRRAGTGETRWLARRGEYIRDADTSDIRFSGVIYDITDLKNTEQKLRDLNDVLEDKVLARTEARSGPRAYSSPASTLSETTGVTSR